MHNAVKLANEALCHNVPRHSMFRYVLTLQIYVLDFTLFLVPLVTPIISMDRKLFVQCKIIYYHLDHRGHVLTQRRSEFLEGKKVFFIFNYKHTLRDKTFNFKLSFLPLHLPNKSFASYCIF